MKVRNGFVSNSSSSSFIIDRNYLSQVMIDAIIERNNREWDNGDEWTITLTEKYLYFYTHMDNFDLESYIITEFNMPKEAFLEDV
jgi:hypothetical protein